MVSKKDSIYSAFVNVSSTSEYEQDDYYQDDVIDENEKVENDIAEIYNDYDLFAAKSKTKKFYTDEEARKFVAQYQALHKKQSEKGLSDAEAFVMSDIYKDFMQSYHGIIGHGAKLGLQRFKINDVVYHRDNVIDGSTSGLLKALNTFSLDQSTTSFSTYLCSCVKNEVSGELKKTFGAKNNDISFEARVKPDDNSDQTDVLGSFVSADGYEEMADENLVISEYEEKYAPRILDLLTKEERAVYVFRKGLFGAQQVNQDKLALFLGMAQPTISNNQSNAERKVAEYAKKHPDYAEMHIKYFNILENNTTRFRTNIHYAPYQLHVLERRRKAQEMFDMGLDLEEIATESNIKEKELIKLVPRFKKGEFRVQ